MLHQNNYVSKKPIMSRSTGMNLSIKSFQNKNLSELIILGTLIVLIYIIPWIFIVPDFLNIRTEEYYEIAKNSLLLFGIAILVMVWGVTTIIKKKVLLYKTPIDLGLFVLIVTITISTLFSINGDTSIWGYHMRLTGGLISSVLLYAVFYLVLNTVKSKKTILFLLKNIIFSINILAIFTILKSFNVFQTLFTEIAKQNTNLEFLNNSLFSPAGNTNSLSFLFVMIVPLALFLFINKKNANNKDLIIGSISTITSLIALTISSLDNSLTFARLSIWLIVFGLLIFNIIYSQKYNKGHAGKLFINIILLVLAMFFFGMTSDNNINQKISEKINFSRYYEIPSNTSWEVINGTFKKYSIKSLFIGIGPDTYAYVFPQFRPEQQNLQPNWFENYTRSNTQIESILINTGILGLLSLILLGFLLLKFIFKKILTKDNFEYNRTLIGLSIFAILFLISFITTFHTISILFFSWFTLALFFKLFILLSQNKNANKIEANFKIITNKNNESFSNIAPYLFTITIVAVSVFMIFITTKNFSAEVFFSKAIKLNEENLYDESYDSLINAVNINDQRDYYHKEIASVALSKLTNLIDTTKKENKTLTETETSQLLSTQQYLLTLINTEINKSIQLNPENYENWQRAALIYKKLTEVSEGKQFGGDALKAVEESINRNPTSPDNYLLLGYLYQYNSDPTLKGYAENAYLKAFELQPSYALSIIQLGSYFEYVNKYSDALQLYTISRNNFYYNESSINKFLNDKIIEIDNKIKEEAN
jgi:hypothetical protein